MALTEEQLLRLIEAKFTEAHLACQPYLLQLARLQLPETPVLRTECSVSSVPVGGNTAIDRISVCLMKDKSAAA
jgi:hypothetical protein